MQLPPEMRREYEAELYRLEAERLGLDRPFLVRSVEYLKNAVTLNLGYAEYIKSETGSQRVSKNHTGAITLHPPVDHVVFPIDVLPDPVFRSVFIT